MGPPQGNANANSNPNSSGNSHGHSNGSSNGNGKGKKRERKPRETRRLVRNGFPVSPLSANGTLLNNVPEQTEPEDLSMTSSGHLNTQQRIRHTSTFSVGSTGGWSAAGSISVGLHSEDDDVDDDTSLTTKR